MKKKHLKPWISNVITLILILIIGYNGYKIYEIYSNENKTIQSQEKYKFEATTVKNEETYQDRFNFLKQTDGDFLGWITFESGLIDLPFVQYTDNEYYLKRSLEHEKSSHGTVFLDAMQTLDSRNITLYGHYVYNNTEIMFSPLAKLANKDEYEANKNFSLLLENEKRNYEVVAVLKWNETEFPYYVGELQGNDDFNAYVKYIQEKSIYDTNIDINPDDKLISLQTCVRNQNDSRWLIVGRQVGVEGVE